MDFSQTLRHLLESRNGIRPNPEYIHQWIREQPPRTVRDRESMHSSILEHFLHRDLRDTSLPTIPNTYGDEPLGSFPPGNGIVLQIVDTQDISNPTHSLLNNLATVAPVRQVYVRRATEDDVQFPRGMLRWTLTDGFTEIIGLESKTISQLKLTTPFGCKLFIKPCEVRRGVMFLTPSNVKVLGGQVDSLYGGNMLAELERRFKARLGLQPIATPENETVRISSDRTIQPAPSAAPPQSDIPQPPTNTIYHQPITAPSTTNTTPSHANNTHNDDEYDIDEFDHDDGYWDEADRFYKEQEEEQLRQEEQMRQEEQLWAEQQRQDQQRQEQQRQEQQRQENQHQEQQRQDNRSTANYLDYNSDYQLDESLNNMDAMSVDLDLADTLADDIPLADQEELDVDLDSNEKTTATVTEVVQYMNDMEDNRTPAIRLSEQVTIQGLCVQVKEFRIKTSGYQAYLEIKNPIIDLESEHPSLFIMLPGSYVTETMGVTTKEYFALKKEHGVDYVQTKYSKPFARQIHNMRCEFQLDLSITQVHEAWNVLIPHVISFRKLD